MTMMIGGIEFTLIRRVGGNMLVGTELRETMTLYAESDGKSLDAVREVLTADACGTFQIDGETVEGYGDCLLFGIDRREGEKLCLILAKPSELERLREAMNILTGETE